jgi:hypothetical protein
MQIKLSACFIKRMEKNEKEKIYSSKICQILSFWEQIYNKELSIHE